MRAYAAFREDGQIVALAEIIEEGDERIGVRLLPGEDSKIAELELPPEWTERPLAEMVARYRVEYAPDGHRLAPVASGA
ncbi:hypothetical protein NLX86_32885 [Streptomyces sp. A3M-1-3]|uniref:hypothetical protein n=1 Tax=Streptomyces sp. A3M-1-3 TaxID=2962044 RepID=UPI0020B72B5B|nr:hypothetical protein [Streptomyces sp. A3M-1-3]MCP3822709.1 hypothetical protein [Streptomyces sp. A3M-1-3]